MAFMLGSFTNGMFGGMNSTMSFMHELQSYKRDKDMMDAAKEAGSVKPDGAGGSPTVVAPTTAATNTGSGTSGGPRLADGSPDLGSVPQPKHLVAAAAKAAATTTGGMDRHDDTPTTSAIPTSAPTAANVDPDQAVSHQAAAQTQTAADKQSEPASTTFKRIYDEVRAPISSQGAVDEAGGRVDPMTGAPMAPAPAPPTPGAIPTTAPTQTPATPQPTPTAQSQTGISALTHPPQYLPAPAPGTPVRPTPPQGQISGIPNAVSPTLANPQSPSLGQRLLSTLTQAPGY